MRSMYLCVLNLWFELGCCLCDTAHWALEQTRCVCLNVLHYMSIVKTGTQIKKCKAVDAQSMNDSTSRRDCGITGGLCSFGETADNICSYHMSHAPLEPYCLES